MNQSSILFKQDSQKPWSYGNQKERVLLWLCISLLFSVIISSPPTFVEININIPTIKTCTQHLNHLLHNIYHLMLKLGLHSFGQTKCMNHSWILQGQHINFQAPLIFWHIMGASNVSNFCYQSLIWRRSIKIYLPKCIRRMMRDSTQITKFKIF